MPARLAIAPFGSLEKSDILAAIKRSQAAPNPLEK
jgi:hypothetical protein